VLDCARRFAPRGSISDEREIELGDEGFAQLYSPFTTIVSSSSSVCGIVVKIICREWGELYVGVLKPLPNVKNKVNLAIPANPDKGLIGNCYISVRKNLPKYLYYALWKRTDPSSSSN